MDVRVLARDPPQLLEHLILRLQVDVHEEEVRVVVQRKKEA